mgnify:CR=1 FL=1
MRSKIAFSRFASILTAVLFVLLFVGCIASIHNKTSFVMILSVYVVLIVCALFYGTAYVEATPDKIILGSLLRRKTILMRDVAGVELFQPTMGAIRIFASGGFMGYWGFFKEDDLGRYYAFYGKSSDCFLVRLKNGDKYVLGCTNPESMVDYIKSQISAEA